MGVQRLIERVADVCVVVVLLFYGWAVPTLASNLSDRHPYGGPDEEMHRSVSGYIARHLQWPAWDSKDLLRYKNGASYATGNSFGYWIEGLLERFAGRSRLGSLALFALLLTLIDYMRDRSTGLVGFAMLTPQVAFVFAYVNSEVWTALVAFLSGRAAARFRREPQRTGSIVFLFAMLAACLTARVHLWPLAALVGAYVLVPRLRTLWRERRGALLRGALVAIPLAMWWPVTSFRANDGDPLGFAASRRAQESFHERDAAPMFVPWNELELREWAETTARSFYGMWGWMYMRLDDPVYFAAAALGGVWALVLAWLGRRFVPLLATLFLVNVILMLIYTTTYDYQPQGRYLFPSFFLGMGLILEDLALGARANESPRLRIVAGALSLALVVLNVTAIVWLGNFWAASKDLPMQPLLR